MAKRNKSTETGRDRSIRRLKEMSRKPLADILGKVADDLGIVAELGRTPAWERAHADFTTALKGLAALCADLPEQRRERAKALIVQAENACSDQWVLATDAVFNDVAGFFLRGTPIGNALGLK